MMIALNFDELVTKFHHQLDRLPDHRTGQNKTYSLKDAVLGAFSVFFTQSPSFLAHQQKMKQAKGRSNAETLFGIEKIPSDNQIRGLLDPISPRHLFPVFDELLRALEQSGQLAEFQVLDGQLLVSLDGTGYFSSKAIHCQNCLHRTTAGRKELLSYGYYAGHRQTRLFTSDQFGTRIHYAPRWPGKTG